MDDLSDQKRLRFEILVKTWTDDLFRYAFWLCKDHNIAEELVQETFTRAWKYFDQLREENKAKNWLFTIAKRENTRRYKREPLEKETLGAEQITVRENYDTSTEAFVLRQALNKLSPKYREPLILQIVGGYSIKEIAHQLDLSEGAVMTRVHRARQKLRHTLQGSEKS